MGREGVRGPEPNRNLGLGKLLFGILVLNGRTEVASQSYGGFMSSKVVEANAGVHSLAMAVAVGNPPFQCVFRF